MAMDWNDIYQRQSWGPLVGEHYSRAWDTYVQKTVENSTFLGNVSHPFYVDISSGESCLTAYRELCFVEKKGARKCLRIASAKVHWPILRLMFIALEDSACSLYIFPPEIILRICYFLAPHAFMK